MNPVNDLMPRVQERIIELLPELQTRRYEITWKPDGSPVTEADVFLEQQLRDLLQSTLPGLNFIGEESWIAGQSPTKGWVAVLDPIDGTENFCSGLKEWGVSLSIWHDGRHQASLLMMPELNEAMSTGNIPSIPRSRIVGFSSSFSPDIGKGLSETPEGRIMGCAVYNLFNVIRGAFSRFVNPKGAYSWDLLAGVSLAHEAGCKVEIDGKDYDGRFLEPGRRYCVDIRHR